MYKRSLVLLSAFALALCVAPLHASDAGSKDAAKNKKTAKTATKRHKSTAKSTTTTSTKKHKGTAAMTTPSTPTGSDQTTITPGGSLKSGQTSYDPKKGRKYPPAPKKKKP